MDDNQSGQSPYEQTYVLQQAPAQQQPGASQAYQPPAAPVGSELGRSAAIASLVLGIVAVALSELPIVPIILAAIGLSQASKAKRLGNTGGLQTAGFILSVLGMVFGVLFLLLYVVVIVATVIVVANEESWSALSTYSSSGDSIPVYISGIRARTY